MTLSLSKLTTNDAAKFLAQQFGCVSDVRALQMAVAAEHIRAALYANAGRTSGFDISPAVHTTRLLTSIRKTLGLLWTKSAVAGFTGHGDSAQLALDALARLGDVVDTGGGFWIGTPLRLIGNTEDASLAILGSLPSPLVQVLSGLTPSSVGAARFAVRSNVVADKKVETYLQSVDDWLGGEEPLDAWTQRLLEQHRANLSSSGGVTADQLEVYAPDIFAARRQNGRWFEARQLAQEIRGLRLCRPLATVAREWNRPFYLAEFGFRSGQTTLARSSPVDFNVTLRLRFGLDRQLQVPRRVMLAIKPDTFDLDLPYSLPEPEQRALGLGWLSSSRPDSRTFHSSAKPLLSRAFERLGIIVETRGGTNVQ